jgi:hypothetical protein
MRIGFALAEARYLSDILIYACPWRKLDERATLGRGFLMGDQYLLSVSGHHLARVETSASQNMHGHGSNSLSAQLCL